MIVHSLPTLHNHDCIATIVHNHSTIAHNPTTTSRHDRVTTIHDRTATNADNYDNYDRAIAQPRLLTPTFHLT